jgi:hypothetical protein
MFDGSIYPKNMGIVFEILMVLRYIVPATASCTAPPVWKKTPCAIARSRENSSGGLEERTRVRLQQVSTYTHG